MGEIEGGLITLAPAFAVDGDLSFTGLLSKIDCLVHELRNGALERGLPCAAARWMTSP